MIIQKYHALNLLMCTGKPAERIILIWTALKLFSHFQSFSQLLDLFSTINVVLFVQFAWCRLRNVQSLFRLFKIFSSCCLLVHNIILNSLNSYWTYRVYCKQIVCTVLDIPQCTSENLLTNQTLWMILRPKIASNKTNMQH